MSQYLASKAVSKWQTRTLFKRLYVRAEQGARTRNALRGSVAGRTQGDRWAPKCFSLEARFLLQLIVTATCSAAPSTVTAPGSSAELMDVPLLGSREETFLTSTKIPFTVCLLNPSHKMVYLNRVIICGRGGRTQGRKRIWFLSENPSLCIPESVRPGNYFLFFH